MRQKRILVVDDDEDLRYLWAESLGNLGYEILTIDDGARALAALQDFQPDLVLLDLIMPRAELDGVGLLSRLSADPTLTESERSSLPTLIGAAKAACRRLPTSSAASEKRAA